MDDYESSLNDNIEILLNHGAILPEKLVEVIVGQREWEIWDVDCAISSLARLHVPVHKNEKGKQKWITNPLRHKSMD